MNLKCFLYGVEIRGLPETMTRVPCKGDMIHWNGTLLEVVMVVWTHLGGAHLYLARDPFDNPLPPGFEEPQTLVPTNL